MVISGVVYSLGDWIAQATVVNLVVGSLVWVEDDMAWIDEKVVHVSGEEIKIICTNEKGDDVGDQWREEPWNYLLAQVVEMFKILSKFYTKTQAVLKRSRDRQDRKVNEGEGTRIVIGATDIGIAIGRNTEG
eukprot:TRINITY_DN5076_c0_g2_i1.p1 TRINITY_DN5076_c0_g2~~TRINITY_DN5076_c0_g2_i1.p1  ORF type:complete len:154 (+),score=28.88 TRINITY_DN5076_c0_g2_i1:69-464(+)